MSFIEFRYSKGEKESVVSLNSFPAEETISVKSNDDDLVDTILNPDKLEITYGSNNTANFEYVRSLVRNQKIQRDTIAIGVCAVSCNRACKNCPNVRAPHFPSKTTAPEDLDKMLELLFSNNMKVHLSFFNNEIFNKNETDWEDSISDILVKYHGRIEPSIFFTNGADLLTYNSSILSLGQKYLNGHSVCLAISANSEASNDHLNIRDIQICIDTLHRLTQSGLSTEVNLLFDVRSEITELDITCLKLLVLYAENNHVTFKLTLLNKSEEISESVNSDNFLRVVGIFRKVFNGKLHLLDGGRLIQTASLFDRKLTCLLDTVPTFHLADNRLTGITTGISHDINSFDDVVKAINSYSYNLLPRFSDCEKLCDESKCYDKLSDGTCPIRIPSKCKKCPLFGTCSGYFYHNIQPDFLSDVKCSEEIMDVCNGLTVIISASVKSGMSEKDLKAEIEGKLISEEFIEHFNAMCGA